MASTLHNNQPPADKRSGYMKPRRRSSFSAPVVFVLVVLGIIFVMSLLFRVSVIQVEGNVHYTDEEIIRAIDIEPDWVHLGQTEDGVPVNSYFADHPDMILGKMVWDDSMYGAHQETACQSLEGADLGKQLAEAVTRISGTYRAEEAPELAEGEAE